MSSDSLDQLRHSAAHLLAAAVTKLYPEALPTIGPSIEDGFYYDFDFGETKISMDDLPKIEKQMKKIVTQWTQFTREEITPSQAEKHFTSNPYKQELIKEFASENQIISLYHSGQFTDLCRGGHIQNPAKQLKYFKLLNVAGAYWRGDEQNKMLTRIYGTAFYTQEELDQYLQMLQEAKKRDHRKIGKEQELFFIDEMVGKGLIMWLPKGQIIRDQIEHLVKEKEAEAGYLRVTTPHIAKKELFTTSGHLPYYQKDMYPGMKMDDGEYYLKAMNCPHHHRIFVHTPKSYRDLPLRIAEYGTCYRNELSGTLAGLLRVRGMAMNDAHIYCRKDQIKQEIKSVIRLTQDYFNIFGLSDYWFRLSKWNPSRTDKYINEPENWQYSQDIIRQVLVDMNVDFVEADDEAAFYGPKVDVQFKSVIGREETMSTIQLDFIAKKRFSLEYTDTEGQQSNEVFVIHRAPLSVHERFLAFLIEHFAGAFPLWLAPIQVSIVPINDDQIVYAKLIDEKLKALNIRTHVFQDNTSMQKKIRTSEKQKIPACLIVGDKEQKSETVSVRLRGQQDLGQLDTNKVIEAIAAARDQRALEISF